MKGRIVAAAAVVTLALVGCASQGVELDREVEVAGLTMSVPSDWVEDGSEEYADDYGFGLRSYESGDPEGDGYGRIDLYYSESSDDTPESYIEELYGEGMDYEMEDGPVIDGVQTQICKYLFEDSDTELTDVFIYGPEMHYRISLYGEEVDAERILETVEIE